MTSEKPERGREAKTAFSWNERGREFYGKLKRLVEKKEL